MKRKYIIYKFNSGWFRKGEKSGFSGNKHSLKSKIKMSQSLKGKSSWNKSKKLHYTVWNKGKSIKFNNALEIWRKNGGQPWNKGLKFEKEEHPLYGKKFSEESKKKMSLSHFGQKAWNKNKKLPQFSKSNHPNWQGGISRLPYSFDFDDIIKEKIRKRDNYVCQNKGCNMTEEEHLIVYGKQLSVHHINYDKQDSNEKNLISLCSQCNSRVNFNREYWKEYFSKREVRNGKFLP